MKILTVLRVLSSVLLILGMAMAVSAGISVLMADPRTAVNALLWSSLILLLPGFGLRWLTPAAGDLSARDGLAIVTSGWFIAAAAGALPYQLSGTIAGFTAAVFESVSGFTTTGASVIAAVEPVAKGILFWRATTHFLGGMGILLLCIAILPSLGAGGVQLYRAEMAGPTKDRLTPRLADTARIMWTLYVLLCALEIILLRLGGMPWFDAVCHAFATIATGGFSTRTASIADFHSLYIELVVVSFMLVGAVNFVLHHELLRGRSPAVYLRDTEFRFFALIVTLAVLSVAANVWGTSRCSPGQALRQSLFSVSSMISTTGFCTTDFDRWPNYSRFVLLIVMVFGGCAGSTAGGMKQFRVVVALKAVARRTRLLFRPQAVYSVKMDGKPVAEPVASAILTFCLLYVVVLVSATAAMCLFVPDIVTALSAVIATTGGVGPGLGMVGPSQNYAGVPAAGQWVLIGCMLAGRLEFYTLLAIFFPSFWRK